MENELKKCKNCGSTLPAGDAEEYCEDCRSKKVSRKKSLGESLFDLMLAPGIIAMSIATRGHRRYKKDK